MYRRRGRGAGEGGATVQAAAWSYVTKAEFGFECGHFSVTLSGNRLVIPGSKTQPLRKSLVPMVSLDDSAGAYTLQGASDGKIVCDLPVNVVWASHPSEPEPFIGLQADNPEELREALRAFEGRALSLTFIPR